MERIATPSVERLTVAYGLKELRSPLSDEILRFNKIVNNYIHENRNLTIRVRQVPISPSFVDTDRPSDYHILFESPWSEMEKIIDLFLKDLGYPEYIYKPNSWLRRITKHEVLTTKLPYEKIKQIYDNKRIDYTLHSIDRVLWAYGVEKINKKRH